MHDSSLAKDVIPMADNVSIPDLTARRTGANTYTVRSISGAELTIGAPGAEGAFSPVELLQAAIAGCASLSAEAQLTNRLGDGFEATTTVAAVYDAEENRVRKLVAAIGADMSELDAETQRKLVASAERAIQRLCTVKRSFDHGVETATEVQPEDAQDLPAVS